VWANKWIDILNIILSLDLTMVTWATDGTDASNNADNQQNLMLYLGNVMGAFQGFSHLLTEFYVADTSLDPKLDYLAAFSKYFVSMIIQGTAAKANNVSLYSSKIMFVNSMLLIKAAGINPSVENPLVVTSEDDIDKLVTDYITGMSEMVGLCQMTRADIIFTVETAGQIACMFANMYYPLSTEAVACAMAEPYPGAGFEVATGTIPVSQPTSND